MTESVPAVIYVTAYGRRMHSTAHCPKIDADNRFEKKPAVLRGHYPFCETCVGEIDGWD